MRSLPIAVFLLLVLSAASATAQVAFDRERDQAFGVIAGPVSGAGAMYQEILPTALGYRVAFLGWKFGDSSFLDVGVSGLRVLSDDGQRRVYLVGGASYWRRSEEETVPLRDDQGNRIGQREVDDVDDSVGLGFGVGIDLPFGVRGGLSLEGVFTYWTDSGDLLPLPQVGLHYYF